MKKRLFIIVIILMASSPSIAGECKEHVVLHSAEYLAKEYGKSEMWVLSNVKINLWEKPTP